MHNFLTQILSGHSLQLLIIFIIKTSILLSMVPVKKWHFCSIGYQALHCVHAVFVPIFQCHALNRHIGLLTKSTTFCFALDLINSVISQYSGEYGQWITTQNVRKKILHTLHFKLTILIQYFSSYIKKCQTGTYFFG